MRKHTVKKIINLILITVIVSLVVPFAASCGSETSGTVYKIYYTNSSGDDVTSKEYKMTDNQTKTILDKASVLLGQMFQVDLTDEMYYSVKPDFVEFPDITVCDYETGNDDEKYINLNFDDKYLLLTNVQEIILRSAVVLTLIQIDGVSGVSFTVNGEGIKDSEGKEIGIMTSDVFVNIILNEEGMLTQEVDVKIWFSDENGECLIPETSHLELSSMNQSIEWYILAKLITGPDSEDVYRTISKDVEILSVTTTDGTCYINFAESFLEQEQPFSDKILIYSIVNSLCELSYVNNVQILIEGQIQSKLHNDFDISQPLNRDLTLESTDN